MPPTPILGGQGGVINTTLKRSGRTEGLRDTKRNTGPTKRKALKIM